MSSPIQKFNEGLLRTKRSPETIDQYMNTLERVNKFLLTRFSVNMLEGDISAVTEEMLACFYQSLVDRNLATNTLNTYVSTIMVYFDMQELTSNPAKALPYASDRYASDPPEDPEDKSYSDEEIVRFILTLYKREDYVSRRDLALTALFLASGLRISEACRLNVSHLVQIKEKGMIFCRRKGGAWKWVNVAPFAVHFLELYVQTRPDASPEDPLFLSGWGNRLNRKTSHASMKTKQRMLGQRTGQHTYRRKFITDMSLAYGIPVAQEAAGHKFSSTTDRYISPSRKTVQAAVSSQPLIDMIEAALSAA